LRFKKHGNLLDDEFGESVKDKYLAFARITDSYINDLYNDWEHLVSNAAVEKLRTPVLKSIAKYDTTKTEKEKGAASASIVLPPPPYRVSFPEELKMIIRESRYLDKMGFRIPENALNITLQDNKYYTISRTLNEKLFEYDRCMETLTKTEKIVMKAHIDELNNTIKVGFYPLNWTSQRIPAYIEELDMALVKFKSTISQLHKNASMIEEIVNGIASTLLIQPKDFKSSQTGVYEPMDISEFYEIIDSRRVARLDALVAEYKTIGDSFLLKVEEVVAKTATGFSPVLAAYYNYW
jgi:dynein heavy chain